MGQEQINRQGQAYIRGLAHVVTELWAKCCEHEGIETGVRFVVWSDDNPYRQFYDKAYSEYVEARRQYAAGGYVGQQIRRKR